MESPRRRTYTWSDPTVTAEAASRLSGLDLLTAIGAGEVPPPPVMDTLGFDAVEVEPGRIVFAMTPAECHYNVLGSLHGGVLATLADSALGCAVHSRLPAGTGYTTLELKVNYIRPVTLATGRIRCEGTVLSLGRRAATAQAQVTDADGRLYVHATTTCLILAGTP